MSRQLQFTVDEAFDGKKLKAFMRARAHTSSATLNKLKNDPMGLLLNGEHVRTVDIVHAGDVLTVNLPDEEGSIAPSDFSSLSVVYEDEDVMVIDKPAGLAMHPTHNHQGDTLANQVAGYFAAENKNVVFRAVGRLDKCTSGLVLIALNRHAASVLSQGYEKEYIAVAGGAFTEPGTVVKNIYRPDPMKTLRAWDETMTKGEYALTKYVPIVTDGERSVVRVFPETGRTHQIRVHFASLGAPLVGDEMYGSADRSAERALLHCACLRFTHPITGEKMSFEAPEPEDMLRVSETIRQNRKLSENTQKY